MYILHLALKTKNSGIYVVFLCIIYFYNILIIYFCKRESRMPSARHADMHFWWDCLGLLVAISDGGTRCICSSHGVDGFLGLAVQLRAVLVPVVISLWFRLCQWSETQSRLRLWFGRRTNRRQRARQSLNVRWSANYIDNLIVSAAGGPRQCAMSRPLCNTQSWILSVINRWLLTMGEVNFGKV